METLITKSQALFAVNPQMHEFLLDGEVVTTESGLFEVGTVRKGAVLRYFIREREIPVETPKPRPQQQTNDAMSVFRFLKPGMHVRVGCDAASGEKVVFKKF